MDATLFKKSQKLTQNFYGKIPLIAQYSNNTPMLSVPEQFSQKEEALTDSSH